MAVPGTAKVGTKRQLVMKFENRIVVLDLTLQSYNLDQNLIQESFKILILNKKSSSFFYKKKKSLGNNKKLKKIQTLLKTIFIKKV